MPDLVAGDYEPALQTVFDVADDVGLPVTFTLAIGNAGDPFFLDALTMVEKANANGRRHHRADLPAAHRAGASASSCPATRS